jgi:hypothetical protein
MPAGSKPGERRGGRQKGTPNKMPSDIKAMIAEALDRAGGADYLVAQADANPGPFMALVGKILPRDTTISAPDGGPVRHEMTVEMKQAAAEALFNTTFGTKEKPDG